MTEIKTRSIPFRPEMVRAILEGRKTQTRRLVKIPKGLVQPSDNPDYKIFEEPYYPGVYFWGIVGDPRTGDRITCPYGEPGNRLWVKEALHRDADGYVRYAADDQPAGNAWWEWKPSKLGAMYCPRWASRLTLEITNIRVERLWDITEQDAIAEGVERQMFWSRHETPYQFEMWKDYSNGICCFDLAKYSFESLWQSIHGPESWQANPWLWVIEFRRVEGE